MRFAVYRRSQRTPPPCHSRCLLLISQASRPRSIAAHTTASHTRFAAVISRSAHRHPATDCRLLRTRRYRGCNRQQRTPLPAHTRGLRLYQSQRTTPPLGSPPAAHTHCAAMDSSVPPPPHTREVCGCNQSRAATPPSATGSRQGVHAGIAVVMKAAHTTPAHTRLAAVTQSQRTISHPKPLTAAAAHSRHRGCRRDR
jgi:hypothetical protein